MVSVEEDDRKTIKRLKHEERVLQHHMASLCGSLAMTYIGYPFDTVKTILQLNGNRGNILNAVPAGPGKPVFTKQTRRLLSSATAQMTAPRSNPVFQISIPTTSRVIATQLFKYHGLYNGFYRGVSMPVVSVMGMHLIGYPTYLKLKHTFGNEQSMSTIALSGMVSGLAVSFVTSPVELIKIRVQATRGLPPGSLVPNQTVHSCLRRIISKEGGYLSLYRGWASTAIRDIPGSAGYFIMYELLTRKFSNDGKRTAEWLFLAGASSSLFNWLLVLPMDNIKTQIQANAVTNQRPELSSWLNCLKSTIARPGGISNLYRGWDILILRSIPTNIVCLLGYKLSLQYMRSNLE